MPNRNVNNKYLKNFLAVLTRYEIPYTIDERENKTYSKVDANLSSKTFHRYIERAMCEYESEHLHNGRFVISYNELQNHKSELQQEFFPNKKGMAYHILSKDKEKVQLMY